MARDGCDWAELLLPAWGGGATELSSVAGPPSPVQVAALENTAAEVVICLEQCHGGFPQFRWEGELASSAISYDGSEVYPAGPLEWSRIADALPPPPPRVLRGGWRGGCQYGLRASGIGGSRPGVERDRGRRAAATKAACVGQRGRVVVRACTTLASAMSMSRTRWRPFEADPCFPA